MLSLIEMNFYKHFSHFKVLRPSDPNHWKNVEWIPYVFSKEYCSECQINRVMGKQFGTITFCHRSLKANFSDFSHRAKC